MMRCYVALFSVVVSIKQRKEVIAMKENTKKVWSTPVFVEYGSVETLTQVGIKLKDLGTQDDFGVIGVSSP
jgi:hypothetical protein